MYVRIIVMLTLCCVAAAAPESNPRIVGGSLTTISSYPSIASLLFSSNYLSYYHACGGTIINSRHILTAAKCIAGDSVYKWRVRVGSTYANSGGIVHSVSAKFLHPDYTNYLWIFHDDIAILRTLTTIEFVTDTVASAALSVSNYYLPDDDEVWAAGWGKTSYQGTKSEQLREVKMLTVNQSTCKSAYKGWFEYTVDKKMVCAGWMSEGGRDTCGGDNGGPLFHNNFVVGITSWGTYCGNARYPGVYTRISSYSDWIRNIAYAAVDDFTKSYR